MLHPIGSIPFLAAQMTVFEICETALFSRLGAAERRAWMKMALSSQVVALGLRFDLIHYDLIVLEKPNLDNTGANSIENPAVDVLEGK